MRKKFKSVVQLTAFTCIGISSLNVFAKSANVISNLPEPVTNNAVTYIKHDNNQYLVSFSGLSTNKDHKAVHNKTFVYNFNQQKWRQASSVPIAKPIIDESHQKSTSNNLLTGRLASIAVSLNGVAYVFGGYTVASNHHEVSIPDVYQYDVVADTYTLLAPMPVPVDDSVALTYQDRYIYLISGWHNDGNVNLVQVYDTKENSWSQASPFPGNPVFGQAGGIVNNKMLICDGVKVKYHEDKRRTFAAEPACYIGVIKDNDVNKIDWRTVKHPTGVSRYRMASLGLTDSNEIVFVGGSNNPYNYDGIGYNGKPSSPSADIWHFNLSTQTWDISISDHATMDHRGLVKFDGKLFTIGGMGANQKVLSQVIEHQVTTKK